MGHNVLGLTFRPEETEPIERAKRAIALKLRSHPGVMAIASAEEQRVLAYLRGLLELKAIPQRRLVTWSLTEGFREDGLPFEPWPGAKRGEDAAQKLYDGLSAQAHRVGAFGADDGGAPPPLADVLAGLHVLVTVAQMIGPSTASVPDRRADPEALFVLRDPGAAALERPEVQRMLRELRYHFSFTKSALVLLAPSWTIPPDLQSDLSVERFPLPTPPELVDVVVEVLGRMPATQVGVLEGRGPLIQAIAESCRGMTFEAARQAIGIAVLDQRGLTDGVVERVQEERRHLVGRSQALVIEDAKLTFAEVRDLEVLEEYVESRRLGFGPEARAYGLDAPKGVLLLGVPGGGKSAAAQAVARAWGLMLVRLNVGAIFGGLVGQSEANLRRALEVLDSLGPVLLWVDEVDKGFATTGEGDSGTSMRVLQELLTWLQQRPGGTVCYFTANDISAVRPELLRKGRIDEIFFADLPGEPARRDILGVHLRRRGRPEHGVDLARVAQETQGFVGSELEQLVVEALYRARVRDAAGPSTEDFLDAARQSVPLARAYASKIMSIRAWVKDGRARSASRGTPVPLDTMVLASHPGAMS